MVSQQQARIGFRRIPLALQHPVNIRRLPDVSINLHNFALFHGFPKRSDNCSFSSKMQKNISFQTSKQAKTFMEDSMLSHETLAWCGWMATHLQRNDILEVAGIHKKQSNLYTQSILESKIIKVCTVYLCDIHIKNLQTIIYIYSVLISSI